MSEWWLVGGLSLVSLIAAGALLYPLRGRRTLVVALFPLILFMNGYFYALWGGFSEWSAYLDKKTSQELAQKMLQKIKGPQEIIDKMRAHLAKNPDSAKGWFLLGRLYSNIQNSDEALASFAKAYRLDSNDEQFAVHYAHALWSQNHQQFNPEMTSIFKKLLKNNPKQADALAMLAMDAYQREDYEVAIKYWERLLEQAPPQSDEARAIRKAIAKAQSSK